METNVNSKGRNAAQRYVDILSDAGFKAVFGDERNKDVLVDLINVVLPEDRHVKDIAYSTTEIPGLTLANKSIRIDLRCTGDDGSVFTHRDSSKVTRSHTTFSHTFTAVVSY